MDWYVKPNYYLEILYNCLSIRYYYIYHVIVIAQIWIFSKTAKSYRGLRSTKKLELRAER